MLYQMFIYIYELLFRTKQNSLPVRGARNDMVNLKENKEVFDRPFDASS